MTGTLTRIGVFEQDNGCCRSTHVRQTPDGNLYLQVEVDSLVASLRRELEDTQDGKCVSVSHFMDATRTLAEQIAEREDIQRYSLTVDGVEPDAAGEYVRWDDL